MASRIAPIEKPRGILPRLIFFFLKKEFGKVITPAKVIYARYPRIGLLVRKIYKVEKGFKFISEPEQFLIQNLVATLNGCTFCMDISKRRTVDKKIGLDKFFDLLVYKSSDRYTAREKAIFNYVEEMTTRIIVSDDIYDNLRQHCSDEEIIEITYTAASESFLNRLIKPLNIGSDELCEIR